MSKKLNI